MSNKTQGIYDIITDLVVDLASEYEADKAPDMPLFTISPNLHIELAKPNTLNNIGEHNDRQRTNNQTDHDEDSEIL